MIVAEYGVAGSSSEARAICEQGFMGHGNDCAARISEFCHEPG